MPTSLRRKADRGCRRAGQVRGPGGARNVHQKPNNTKKQYLIAGGTPLALSSLSIESTRENIMKSQQSGFTLVEIAIVLVIIGLLLGGILKGQELINSAKVKNLANDFRVIPTYVYGFQDKFKALPGDDSAAQTHLSTCVAPCRNGNGNGVINGSWNTSTATDETWQFWAHVRLANLAA